MYRQQSRNLRTSNILELYKHSSSNIVVNQDALVLCVEVSPSTVSSKTVFPHGSHGEARRATPCLSTDTITVQYHGPRVLGMVLGAVIGNILLVGKEKRSKLGFYDRQFQTQLAAACCDSTNRTANCGDVSMVMLLHEARSTAVAGPG